MNLTEHQAKKILATTGLKVPAGRVSQSVEDAVAHLGEIGDGPWVVKAQIQAGGRANGHFINDPQARGGIRFVSSASEVRSNVMQMLGAYLVTPQTRSSGEYVDKIYIEEQCTVETELYLALTLDRDTSSIAFMASREGGANIEQIAQRDHSAVRVFPVDIETREIPESIGEYLEVTGDSLESLNNVLAELLDLFVDRDASLIEINPLGLLPDGQLVALDATIVWDDNALFRQGHEEQLSAYDDLSDSEYVAIQHGLNYIKLTGNIGILAAGAGLAMATMDAIRECDGTPANFLDVPPSASVDRIQVAIEILLKDPAINGVLINVFGGGIMRCDAVVDALLLARKSGHMTKPVVVRLVGTNAELALQRLRTSLPECRYSSDLATASKMIVELTEQNANRRAGDKPREKLSWWKRARRVLADGHAIEES